MLRILGRTNSINVRKVLWLCEELAVSYRREDWGCGYRPTSDPVFRKLSPHGTVPVLVEDGFVLRESHAILRYLAGKPEGESLYPREPRRRALVEQWMDWGATDVDRHLRPLYLGGQLRLEPYFVPALLEHATASLNQELAHLERELGARGPFLLGATFTLADIVAGLIINRCYQLKRARAELPAVADYYQRLAERPGYRRYGCNGLA